MLNSLGAVAWAQGQYPRARAWFEQSLALRRDLDDRPGTARCLNNLGTLASDLGEYAEAWARHAESLALRRALNDHGGIAQSMHNLGEVAHRRGDHGIARRIWHQSLVVARDLGNVAMVAGELGALARAAAALGEYQVAAGLFGVAEAVRAAIRLPLSRSDHDRHAEGIEQTRAALGDAALTAAQDAASLLEVEDAIARGLAWGPCTCGTVVAGIAPPEGARCANMGSAVGVAPGRPAGA